MVSIGRTVNAFVRWEFNSCETLVAGRDVHPIDYANACPDLAITSLRHYVPWATESLLKWCVFRTATGRRALQKLAACAGQADRYLDNERYRDFESAEFDRVLVDAVTSTFPAHEHDLFVSHYRGLLAAWCRDERARVWVNSPR